MSTEPDSSAPQRFARDLRRIREERDVSLATVHAATQVPVSHLQAFEEGTLYDQSRMNPIYLRAFVRAYAEAVGLPSDPVVEHLNAALKGEYQNQLAVQYLDVPSSVSEDAPSPDPEESHSPERPSDATIDKAEPGETGRREVSDAEASPSPKATQDDGDAAGESGAGEEGTQTSPAVSTEGRTDPSSHTQEGAPSRSQRGRKNHWNSLGWAAMALFVLVLLGGGLFLYFGTSSSSSDPASRAGLAAAEQPSDTSVTSDTSQSSPSRTQPSANLTLQDTLHVTVFATSAIQGIRIQQDDDLRRPYWIEEGDARVFPFTRRITIENGLDSLRFFLERHPYPTSRTDDEGRIVIHRDTAQQFADTLRGAPVSLSAPPDTVPIDGPLVSEPDSLAGVP